MKKIKLSGKIHLLISFTIFFVSGAIARITNDIGLMTISLIFIYIGVFSIFYIGVAIVKTIFELPKKEKNKKQNHYYSYKKKNYKVGKKEEKEKYKSMTDKLYDEAVKYYGKHYVKGKSKQDVVDEYLNE